MYFRQKQLLFVPCIYNYSFDADSDCGGGCWGRGTVTVSVALLCDSLLVLQVQERSVHAVSCVHCYDVYTFCLSRKQQEKEKCKSSTTWRGYVSEQAAVRRMAVFYVCY